MCTECLFNCTAGPWPISKSENWLTVQIGFSKLVHQFKEQKIVPVDAFPELSHRRFIPQLRRLEAHANPQACAQALAALQGGIKINPHNFEDVLDTRAQFHVVTGLGSGEVIERGHFLPF